MTAYYKTMYSEQTFPTLPKYFSGKWNQKPYTVLGELGRGANGVVYLVSHHSKKFAVKIGLDAMDLLMEVNLLKSVQKDRDTKIGPLICDVDDVVVAGKTYSFYVMEYVEGENLSAYIERVGVDWIPICLIQILSQLQILHDQGWVFGDMKPENAIVSRIQKQVCLIDFGGVSKIGNAVRQFTEEYDRAYWQAGDRRADKRYDLFALALMMIRLATNKAEWKRITYEARQLQSLYGIIRDNETLYPYRMPLIKALQGNYASAREMKADLIEAFRERATANSSKPVGGRVGKWISGLFVASLFLLAGSLYLVWM